MTIMSGWTRKEIEAELARRSAAELSRDRERAESARREEAARANALCLHCGNPFVSHGADQPLCATCLGDE
jgi:hypothetical protein